MRASSHVNHSNDPSLVGNAVAFDTEADMAKRIRELLLLAKEQGHLTHDDIQEAMPDSVVGPEYLDQIYTKLHNLDVHIAGFAVHHI